MSREPTGGTLPRVVRATSSGLVGTSVMTFTLWLERRARRNAAGPVDYDASSHVVTAASNALHLRPRTDGQRRALFLLVHWGYGSAVGVLYRAIRPAAPNDLVAASTFFAACQSMAFTLFPVFGKTPPPWQWRRDILVSSLVQHAIYAASVAAAERVPGPGDGPLFSTSS